MPKLNQIIAVVSGKKSRAESVLKDAHHGWRPELIQGISRTYYPLDAEGDSLPPENKRVQIRTDEVVSKAINELIGVYDAVATQETGNTIAKADVVVDGKSVLKNVPVSVLLFLEKQIKDIRTFVTQMPTLPTDREWKYDSAADCYVTEPVEQIRTAKMPTRFVKAEATDKHPAQVEILYVDKTVGRWNTKHFSGAIPAQKQADLLSRVNKLEEAVKSAREQANSTEVQNVQIGKDLFSFIFGDIIPIDRV